MHNLVTAVTELIAKLATRSRHVCVLLGAGASVGAGLPDLNGLTKLVRNSLEGEDPESLHQLDALIAGRNLEQALTRLRRIASLLDNDTDTIDKLTRGRARALDARICQAIIEAIRNPTKPEAFYRFGSWASRATYSRPLEIFTTNYDLLIEGGLEHFGVTYFDGFAGHLEGYFRADLVELAEQPDVPLIPSSFIRVWKLHGSSNWETRSHGNDNRIVRLGSHASRGSAVAIYPSDEKYSDSRRVPFVVLMDRFRRALSEPETLLLVNGFSFGDQHLNEIIFESARRRPRSEFVVTCYSKIPDVLRAAALETRNLTVLGASEGIIGGHAAEWKVETTIPGVSEANKCKLGDFACLASVLDGQATLSSAS